MEKEINENIMRIHNALQGIASLIAELDESLVGALSDMNEPKVKNSSSDSQTYEVSVDSFVDDVGALMEALKERIDQQCKSASNKTASNEEVEPEAKSRHKAPKYNAFYNMRIKRGWDREFVSNLTGLDVSLISQLEKYNVNSKKKNFEILRAAYGIGRDYYLDGVCDKLRLLGLLLEHYKVDVASFCKKARINYSTVQKYKYLSLDKAKEDIYVNSLIDYLKNNGNYKNVDKVVEDLRQFIISNSYDVENFK